MFIRNNPKTEHVGKGLITRVPDWQGWMRWADLVFLSDNVRYLKELESWRKEGKAIIGPTLETAAWELERSVGMDVFRKHGIKVADYKEFSDYDKAIAYVKKEGRAFVSKPCGDEPDKSLSYVAKTPADLVYMLERWKKSQRHKGNFILQEKLEGIEMAVGGWFGPGGFNEGYCENFEFKKLFPGDLGPATGEQGTVLRMVKKSKLADKVLKPFAPTLEKLGYTGYVDVNCIIDEKGVPWPLEFTMRPGWPTFQIQQALLQGDPADWLMDLTEGRDARNWDYDKIAVGVVLAVPDYPYSHLTKKEIVGIPLYIPEHILPKVSPSYVMAGEAPHDVDGKVVTTPCWVTAGDYVLTVTGTGATVTAARKSVYGALKQIKVPNSPFWRTDIGVRLGKQLSDLQAHGFATGVEY